MTRAIPARDAAREILIARGYTSREIDFAFRPYKATLLDKHTKSATDFLVREHQAIDRLRDRGRVGTTAYEGIAYFWSHKYRYQLRDGEATGLREKRRKIHARFLAARLPVDGCTPEHDKIIEEETT